MFKFKKIKVKVTREEEKEVVYAQYKNNPPAKVAHVEQKGKNIYLHLLWDNLGNISRVVPEKNCKKIVKKEIVTTSYTKEVGILGFLLEKIKSNFNSFKKWMKKSIKKS